MKLFLFFISLLLACPVLSQGWAWVSGDPSSNVAFGTVGVASSNNTPGERYSMTPWVDNTGNLWGYAGLYTITGVLGAGDDLWKFDLASNQWELVKGSYGTTIVANFGTQGVPSSTNTPGAISLGAPHWVDDQGDFWIAGGHTPSDDIWHYDIATNIWTWMSGSGGTTTPSYGTMGVEDPSNSPGMIYGEYNFEWKDDQGNFWMYNGLTATMWRYNPNTLNWTWMAGTPNATPSYGTIGVPSLTNTPGEVIELQVNSMIWISWQADNELYMIFRRVNLGDIEMWRFDLQTLQWTCEYRYDLNWGSEFGPLGHCVPDPLNLPVFGQEQRVRWLDDCNNLWLLLPDNPYPLNATQTNLWRFDYDTKYFELVDQYNSRVTGTQGVRSTNNSPFNNATAGTYWTSDGKFWLMEGDGNDDNSILWNFEGDTVNAQFTYVTNCNTVYYTDSSLTGCNNIKSHEWDFGDGNTLTTENPSVVHTYSSHGTYSVTYIAHNCTWDSDTITQLVTVTPCGLNGNLIASEDTICNGGCVEITASANSGDAPYTYTWINPSGISGPGPHTVCPTNNETYEVTIEDSQGATITATTTVTVINVNAAFTASPTSGTAPLNVNFTNQSTNATDYTWYIDTTVSNQTNPQYTFQDSTYEVILVAHNGSCTDTARMLINESEVLSILEVPNIITINGDGVNDVFEIVHSNILDFELGIYNRWGNLLYQTKNIDAFWDGTFEGKTVSAGTYYYSIQATAADKTYNLKGHLTVVRN